MANDDSAHDVMFSIRIESVVQKPDCLDLDSEKLKLLSRRQREKRYRDSARMAKTFYYAFTLTKGDPPVKTDAFTFENPLWNHNQRLRVTNEMLMQFYKKPLKFKVLERIMTQGTRDAKDKDTASIAQASHTREPKKEGKRKEGKEANTLSVPKVPSRPASVAENQPKRILSTATLRHGDPSSMHLNRPESPGSESNNGDDRRGDPYASQAQRDANRRRKQSISIELQHVGELLVDLHPLLMGELTTSAELVGNIPGLDEARVTVTVDEPLMSYWQAQQLNPLTVTVIRARNLPDNPGGYDDLYDKCLPVTYKYKLLGFADSKPSRGLPHAREVEWNERQLFFAGIYDQDEFREKLTGATFVVEVHDRDRRPPDMSIQPCVYGDGDAKVEEELAGGITRHMRQRIERDPFLGPPAPWDPHGIASFSLQNLLHGKDTLQMTSNILPCRAPPKRGQPDAGQMAAGLYIESGAELEIRVQLLHPFIDQWRPQKAFSRAIYMFNRGEDDLAARLEQLIVAINTSSLHLDTLPPTVVSAALASYKLSREQKSSRTLNLVTGFQCVDADGRIFVIEGLAALAMERIWNAMLRAAEGRNGREETASPVGRSGSAGEQRMRQLVQIASRRFRVLYNPELTFGERLYAAFDACIRTFRLSEPLDTLLTYPLLYVRGTVPHECMAGLTKLHGIRQMHRLRDVVRLDLLPTAAMVVSVAKTVGMVLPDDEDAAFRAAMVLAERPKSSSRDTPYDASVRESMRSSSASPTGRRKSSLLLSTLQDPVLGMSGEPARGQMASRTGGITSVIDARNGEYEEHMRRGRHTANFVKENIARFPYHEPAPREVQGPNEKFVHIYSSQKLNTAEMQKKEIRERIAEDKRHIYTYSDTFHSLSFCPVDTEEEKKQKEEASKKLWLTNDGFVSTLQRTTEELYRHPKRPDDARIEALREPWTETTMQAHVNMRERKPFPWDRRHMDFDAVGHPLIRLGEPQKSSVHLPCEPRRREYKDYVEKEKEQWEAKVVVDNIDFKTLIVGSSEHDRKAQQTDRMKGLLKDAPMKLTLRGRFQAPDPPPLSLTTGGDYQNESGRVHVAKDKEPLDLTRHIT